MFHYGSGNYEAFAHPRVPKDIEQKHAYIMGSGLARSEERRVGKECM